LVGALKDGSVCAWFEHNDREGPLDLRLYRANEFEKIELPKEKWNRGEVIFIREGSNGDLWICQGATLIRYRRSTRTAEHHGPENGLKTDRVFALADVGDGRIWCGSAARIYEFHGQRWEPIMSTLDRVTEIVASPGNVWVSTLSGVHRLFDNSWFFYSAKEGLPAGAVYSLRAGPDDRVWAGTSRGAFVFHADADLDPPRTLNPYYDEVQKPTAGEPLLIHFQGKDKWDYTFPPDLLFSYRLDEGNWSLYSNVTSHVFQKLAAGGHVLEVLAMDRNGNKAVTPGRLEFAVIVPWFKDPRLVSVSFLALCSSLVLAGLAVNKHFQLKRSYARVEQMVEERTRELDQANRELLHGQKMRALGTMAAGIAHDFNNILSIIKGSAQIIENNVQDPEKIRTRVGRIQMMVEQGTVIVKALLGLGKTEQKDLSDCDIHQLLHETRKILSDRFPETVQFQIEAPDQLPLVHCAPEVVQQILLNLILNAVEAMHNEGFVELRASATKIFPPKPVLEPEQSSPEQMYVLISVVDQGGGITPENLPRIFEPFFTTKAFSTRRGTGLGLSMVYELAKAQGYGLAVETKVGRGSTFSMIIPVLGSPADGAKK
jgi:signal transduction histidine kinase